MISLASSHTRLEGTHCVVDFEEILLRIIECIINCVLQCCGQTRKIHPETEASYYETCTDAHGICLNGDTK